MTAQLLRQPGGFEGFLSRGERLHPHELPLPVLRQPGRLREVERHVAFPAPSMPRARARTRSSPRSRNSSRSRLELLPIPLHVLDPPPHPLMAVVAPSLEDGRDRNPLDLRVEKRIKVVGPFRKRPVECLEAPAGNLQVLLRHRPRSIAPCLRQQRHGFQAFARCGSGFSRCHRSPFGAHSCQRAPAVRPKAVVADLRRGRPPSAGTGSPYADRGGGLGVDFCFSSRLLHKVASEKPQRAR